MVLGLRTTLGDTMTGTESTILIFIGVLVGWIAMYLYQHHKIMVLKEQLENQKLQLAKLKLSSLRFIPEPYPHTFITPIPRKDPQ